METDPAEARVVLVTLPDEAAAETLVERLVAEAVVACGSIVPGVTSIYRWQGAVERTREALVVFKTTAARTSWCAGCRSCTPTKCRRCWSFRWTRVTGRTWTGWPRTSV